MGKVEMMHMWCCQLWRREMLKELGELWRSGLLQSGNVDIFGQLVTVQRKRNNRKGKLFSLKLIFFQSLFLQFLERKI